MLHNWLLSIFWSSALRSSTCTNNFQERVQENARSRLHAKFRRLFYTKMERGNTIIPCQICHCSEAKYRCPGCDVRTCRYGAFLHICVVSRVRFNKVLGVLKSTKPSGIVMERDARLHLLARLSSPTTTCSAVSISVFSSIFSVS